jgi:hypothetical protein
LIVIEYPHGRGHDRTGLAALCCRSVFYFFLFGVISRIVSYFSVVWVESTGSARSLSLGYTQSTDEVDVNARCFRHFVVWLTIGTLLLTC